MSQTPFNNDDLARHLRDYFGRRLPAPPAPEAIWRQVAAELRIERELTMSAPPRDSSSHTPTSASPSSVRPHRNLSAIKAIVTVAVLIVLAATIFALHPFAHPASTTKTVIHQPGSFSSISMDSATDGWAVGSIYSTTCGYFSATPLLYHYTNGAWHPVSLDLTSLHINLVPCQPANPIPSCTDPNTTTTNRFFLNGVSMVNDHDGWITGTVQCGGIFLHYDGTTWSRVAVSLPLNSSLGGIKMLSATDGWAFGLTKQASTTGVTPLILHFSNGAWALAPVPDLKQNWTITDLAVGSNNDLWAVGYTLAFPDTQAMGVTLHYLDGKWRITQTFPHIHLIGLAMDTANEGWATGYSLQSYGNNPSTTFQQGIMLHYAHGTWNEVFTILQGSDVGSSITLASPTNGWMDTETTAADAEITAAAPEDNVVLYHYNGTAWQRVLVKVPTYPGFLKATVSNLAILPTGEIWAVGDASNGTQTIAPGTTQQIVYPQPHMVILHYLNGQWTTLAD